MVLLVTSCAVTSCAVPSSGLAIERVDPAVGPTTKDTAVRLEGVFHRPLSSNLDQGDTIVVGDMSATVGGVALAGAVWRDDQLIEGVVPAGLPPGPTDVTVTLGDGIDVLVEGYIVTEDPPSASWVTIETLDVPVNFGAQVTSLTTLQAGTEYHLRVSGTFVVQNDVVPPTESDGEWWGFDAPMDGVPGVDIGMGIDDATIDATRTPAWGPYAPNHVYEVSWIGSGAPISANIHDGRYDNDSGSLTLEILAWQ